MHFVYKQERRICRAESLALGINIDIDIAFINRCVIQVHAFCLQTQPLRECVVPPKKPAP
jgi:hypothetical protein